MDYAKLKGRTDVALPKHRLAIFVHGCYWHGHGCGKGSRPKTNAQFWQDKFARNAQRHERAEAAIRDAGWTPIVIWECDLRDMDRAMSPVLEAIGPMKIDAIERHPKGKAPIRSVGWMKLLTKWIAKVARRTPRR